MKLAVLSIPVPVIGAAILPQLDPEMVSGAPGWVGVLVVALYVLGWYLDRIGRLPGGSGGKHDSTAGFEEQDRAKLHELHALFTHRDSDGVERWPGFLQESRTANRELLEGFRAMLTKLDRLTNAIERQNRGDPKP